MRTIKCVHYNSLLMTRFEPRISGNGSDRSHNHCPKGFTPTNQGSACNLPTTSKA